MSEARIRWISGPVLRAGTRGRFHVYEAVAVGPRALLGEVIKLGPDDFVAQIYEDTTGLKPGDSVAGTGQPLSIPLGPGILGTICDGLLRPLDAADGPFIRPGAPEQAGAALRLRAHGACRATGCGPASRSARSRLRGRNSV